MFDFLIAELVWFSSQYDQQTGIDYSGVPGVLFSDSLIPSELRDALRDATKAVEHAATFKDWHPNSNEQVLDIVHPSLYPYIRGRTRRFLHERKSPEGATAHDKFAQSILSILCRPSPAGFSTPLEALEFAGSSDLQSQFPDFKDVYDINWTSEPHRTLITSNKE